MAARLRAPGFYRAAWMMALGVAFSLGLTWLVRMTTGHSTFRHYIDGEAILTVSCLVAATLVWTLGEILCASTMPAVIAKLAPPARRGTYQGVFTLSWSTASWCCRPTRSRIRRLRRTPDGAVMVRARPVTSRSYRDDRIHMDEASPGCCMHAAQNHADFDPVCTPIAPFG